jgi:hypothetical protein
MDQRARDCNIIPSETTAPAHTRLARAIAISFETKTGNKKWKQKLETRSGILQALLAQPQGRCLLLLLQRKYLEAARLLYIDSTLIRSLN